MFMRSIFFAYYQIKYLVGGLTHKHKNWCKYLILNIFKFTTPSVQQLSTLVTYIRSPVFKYRETLVSSYIRIPSKLGRWHHPSPAINATRAWLCVVFDGERQTYLAGSSRSPVHSISFEPFMRLLSTWWLRDSCWEPGIARSLLKRAF